MCSRNGKEVGKAMGGGGTGGRVEQEMRSKR